MIPKETIDRIFAAARIEEVIGEFVKLKRSGANLKGLSPFTNEKTPSFVVSPAKGIFKDFSSGKGGNVVTFLMEHEHMTYPEALRYLADKYNIEIVEKEQTNEEREAQDRKESLFILSKWAEDMFTDYLHNTDEGNAIGLAYFKERGFTDEIIGKFKLGYAPDKMDFLLDAAKEQGHNLELLLELGLLKKKGERYYDGFRGRVVFPIHNLSGRPIAFGARTLKQEKTIPKYINSPENEIYHKSKIVYGIYQARQSMIKEDNCFLVEGYTDVISLHQTGVENVVASSGTALTAEQINLIGRYTKNITMIYDPDPAGIKASFRGIDLILKEGLNVKAALLPEGMDPDEFAQSHSLDEIKAYFDSNVVDFILFKTRLLEDEVKGDPVKRAGMIREIVESISLIPDHIKRTVYTKECSNLLNVPEKALVSELNKIRVKRFRDEKRRSNHTEEPEAPDLVPDYTPYDDDQPPLVAEDDTYHQELDLLRIILNYGKELIEVQIEKEEEEIEEDGSVEKKYKPVYENIPVWQFISSEILDDELQFRNDLLWYIFTKYLEIVSSKDEADPLMILIGNEDKEVRELVATLTSNPYNLHDWKKRKIHVHTEQERLMESLKGAIYAFKARYLNIIIKELRDRMNEQYKAGEDISETMTKIREYEKIRRLLLLEQGITIFK